MKHKRTEHDSMGSVDIPAGALYGPNTVRAIGNFPISGNTMPKAFISALGRIKLAAAEVLSEMSLLPPDIAKAIAQSAKEIIAGKWDDQFPVDVFQTGSGTSSNMNINEVIANRAIQILGGQIGDKTIVHPNDDVNKCQSSNDVIPTAIHISAALAIKNQLTDALTLLRDALAEKATQFDDIIKIARTHLMDAVPIRLGQEFSGFASQIDDSLELLTTATSKLTNLAIGGTAVGTGLNAPNGFAARVCEHLTGQTNLEFREVSNHFAAQSTQDTALAVSGICKVTAVAMGKIASDIRLLSSGPRCGFGEITLAPLQPGSSIMPGKVNPVICESVIQVACQVIGNDAAITAGATGGVGSILNLNLAMPMITNNLLESIHLLTNAAKILAEKCVKPLTANKQQCQDYVEKSLAMVTVLAPHIGYDLSAKLAKIALDTGKTIRQVCIEEAVCPIEQLDELLQGRKQTESH